MRKKTKIVATISDMRCDVEFIQQLYENGMNVARLNTAHQSLDETLNVVENIRKVSEDIAILLDTKGPEIRTKTENVYEVKEKDTVYILKEPIEGFDLPWIQVNYPNFIFEVPLGNSILIDDGELELISLELDQNGLKCQVQNSGKIKNKKSVNVPGVSFQLPSLNEKDKLYIDFAIQNNLDFIAHSFVRNKEDIYAIQSILDEHNSHIKIIAKIENHEGVENIDEILDGAYGIMVARGDLAIELPYAKIPGIQKRIINKCIERRKPVIIATQMLHSMIENPRPTRAEVSDIANAIYSKADAIMLSGETAYGKYPIEAVKTMANVAMEVEKSRGEYHDARKTILSTMTSAYLAQAAVKASIKLNAAAILADTTTGRTIRNVAGFRGQKIVYATCYSKRIVRELALSFGIYPRYLELNNNHQFINATIESLIIEKNIQVDDTIVVLGGNFGPILGASFIEISTAGNLLKQYEDRYITPNGD